MGRVFKGINILVSFVLVVAAAGVAYVAIPYFGNQALIVRSGSMEPTIGVGSIAVVRAVQVYKAGDIIAFRSENNPKTIITHRVVEVLIERPPAQRVSGSESVFYKTKGDANENIDGWIVDEKNIIGKSYFTLPQLGKLLAFAKSDIGFPFLVIFPAVFVIVIEAYNIIREIRRRQHNGQEQERRSFIPEFNFKAFKVLIPIFAVGLIIPTALAFYGDNETSTGNIFQASSEFPEATSSAQIVINEAYYDPDENHTVGGPDGANASEWIELYNPTSSTVNLKDWKIKDNSSTERTVSTSNRNLGPGEFVVLAKAANVRVLWGIDQSKFIPIGEGFGNGLANDGDRVILKDSFGNIIDQMSYDDDNTILDPPSPNVAKGHSLERNSAGFDTDSGSDFVDRNPPTPGS